jgi:succinate dehydrogenase flavin-adding protein (antitoxin of CptAB toxin-antitoxin module)
MQNQLKQINEVLNDSNIDLLNLITGKKEVADVEDYQQILNKSISEVENIYWKICAK